jgi:hypothetical protein
MQRLIFSIFVFALFLGFGLACADESNSKYFAFVGEKITVEPVVPSPGEVKFDQQFSAKYHVLEKVYGNYDGEVIEFTVFDHHGFPSFAKYDHALIYIEVHDGKYYHAKYMYSPLFETVDGEWAGPYDDEDYNHENNSGTNIKPEIILFRKPVTFDISQVSPKYVKDFYPKPYYRIWGSRAIAVYGNYVTELFLLKQHGVLRARGDFQ